jgi:hypothetical protein
MATLHDELRPHADTSFMHEKGIVSKYIKLPGHGTNLNLKFKHFLFERQTKLNLI